MERTIEGEIGGGDDEKAYEAVKYVSTLPSGSITRHCHPYNRGRTPGVVTAFVSDPLKPQNF